MNEEKEDGFCALTSIRKSKLSLYLSLVERLADKLSLRSDHSSQSRTYVCLLSIDNTRSYE